MMRLPVLRRRDGHVAKIKQRLHVGSTQVVVHRTHQGRDRVRIFCDRGRPVKFPSAVMTFIEYNTLANARLSHSDMKRLVENRYHIPISIATIGRMRAKFRLKYQRLKVTQKLTEAQRRQ